jgi:hypothetical protein
VIDFEKNDKFGTLVVKPMVNTKVNNGQVKARSIDEYKEELNELRRKVADMENGLAQLELEENH